MLVPLKFAAKEIPAVQPNYLNALYKRGGFIGLIMMALATHAAPTATKVAAGTSHSLFIKSDGTLWGMGDNSTGQLGLGKNIVTRKQPTVIASNTPTAVAAGYYHSLFRATNGSLWVMGLNNHGQLGDSATLTNSYVPEQIVASEVNNLIAGGNSHSLFAKLHNFTTGSFWVMGGNYNGQLGDGSINDTNQPEVLFSVFLDNAVTAIAAGDSHSLFVRPGGSLWVVGNNFYGQLGDGTNVERHVPYELLSSNVVGVAGGLFDSFYVKTDGSLWGMGFNGSGQLGDNSVTNRLTPVQIVSNGVTTVAAGSTHTLFLKSDGSLWGMGFNYYGQLGDGTNIDRHVPVQIVASNVMAIAAGYSHSLFVKSNGSLWAMGYNNYGQLGDGTTNNRYAPVLILPGTAVPAINSINLSGTNLVINGSNGVNGGTYHALMSTNLLTPLDQWSPVTTNILGADGDFTITVTNTVSKSIPKRFYALQLQ